MEGLQGEIFKEVNMLIPDIDQERAQELVAFVTSADVGVRSMERLFDLSVEELASKIPMCDARKLYRVWQQKFDPARARERELREQPTITYTIPWKKVASDVMDALEAKKRLKKDQRIRLVQVIVRETRLKYPHIRRDEFKGIAETMVSKYTRSLRDAGEKDKIGYSYIEKKLKARVDEEMRAQKKKAENEAPNVPQAYGCVRWRVQIQQASRSDLEKMRDELQTTFNETRSRDWDWREILPLMEQAYPLQREEINSQTPPKKRRARGAPQLPAAPAKTTREIARSWPFLFRSKGMLLHFKILTQVDIESKFDEYNETAKELVPYLAQKLNEEALERRWRAAAETETARAATTVALFKLIAIYFKEREAYMFREVERTTTADEIEDEVDLPSTPLIISSGPVRKATKFYLTIDNTLLSVVRGDSHTALLTLFASFFVMNIKYPEDCGRTLDFVQRAILGINPPRGTKMSKRNNRTQPADQVQTLLEEFEAHRQYPQQPDDAMETDDAEIDNDLMSDVDEEN